MRPCLCLIVSADSSGDRAFKDYSYRTFPPPLLALRDPGPHSERRKPWNRGFTSAALKEYEIIVQQRLAQLIARIDEKISSSTNEMTGLQSKGAVIDLSKWMSFFT